MGVYSLMNHTISIMQWELTKFRREEADVMLVPEVLFVNGRFQTDQAGATIDGIKLLSVQSDQVVVEIAGRKRPLRVGQHAVGLASDGAGKVILTADGQGHFVTTGTVNGNSVRFLVDTGASMISLGASDARRLGLDPRKGRQGISQTANGQTQISIVKLDQVRVGGIVLHQVDAAIHSTDMPVALLGMSFLNRMEMQRDGATMTLKKRF